ncbi:MAG: monomeric [Alphaproteobacteria bacterium]|nr:monomeric [FeFe] hydrogenase [Alphaproteobacteria bacterium]
MPTETNTVLLRREVIVRLIKGFLSDSFRKRADDLPFDMRPKYAEVPFRCCIHKERAILRERAIAVLGASVEQDDDKTPLGEYAQKSLDRKAPDQTVLTVVETACQGCTPNRIYVTDLCQGCVARPCTSACAFGAVSIKNGRSVIDGSKCKGCTKCMQVCPYGAIVKIKVPCEDACPVGAIAKNEKGHAQIDFSRCLSCGACVARCPFGAVAEKSQIIDILKALQSDKKVVALLAPAAAGQMPVGLGRIASGLIKAGFDAVLEVAQGADITAKTEAKDFQERMERGDSFMTTSCCAAYRELVKKSVPELRPYVSDTATPMHYTAQLAKRKYPDCVTVFVGPCVAKRMEGLQDGYIDYVMNFEEMGALFVALSIELSACEEYVFETPSSKQGRNFAVTGGVAESIRVAGSTGVSDFRPVCVDGLNAKVIREMTLWAKKKATVPGNIIEVMACTGGCVSGAGCLNNQKAAAKKVTAYAEQGAELTPDPANGELEKK